MIKTYELKKIVIEDVDDHPEATATVLFTMQSSKPDWEKLREALTKFVLTVSGQKTLPETTKKEKDEE